MSVPQEHDALGTYAGGAEAMKTSDVQITLHIIVTHPDEMSEESVLDLANSAVTTSPKTGYGAAGEFYVSPALRRTIRITEMSK